MKEIGSTDSLVILKTYMDVVGVHRRVTGAAEDKVIHHLKK